MTPNIELSFLNVQDKFHQRLARNYKIWCPCEGVSNASAGERGKEEEGEAARGRWKDRRATDDGRERERGTQVALYIWRLHKNTFVETPICNFLYVCKNQAIFFNPYQSLQVAGVTCTCRCPLRPFTIYRIECKSFPKGRGMRSRQSGFVALSVEAFFWWKGRSTKWHFWFKNRFYI